MLISHIYNDKYRNLSHSQSLMVSKLYPLKIASLDGCERSRSHHWSDKYNLETHSGSSNAGTNSPRALLLYLELQDPSPPRVFSTCHTLTVRGACADPQHWAQAAQPGSAQGAGPETSIAFYMEKFMWNQQDTDANSTVFPDTYHGFHNFSSQIWDLTNLIPQTAPWKTDIFSDSKHRGSQKQGCRHSLSQQHRLGKQMWLLGIFYSWYPGKSRCYTPVFQFAWYFPSAAMDRIWCVCYRNQRKHRNWNQSKHGNRKREEKRYLLKSGSVFITSLKNMAACEAKPECQWLRCSSATPTCIFRWIYRADSQLWRVQGWCWGAGRTQATDILPVLGSTFYCWDLQCWASLPQKQAMILECNWPEHQGYI